MKFVTSLVVLAGIQTSHAFGMMNGGTCVQPDAPALADIDYAIGENWYPSKWGANDIIGAANYITPEKTVEASHLIKTGQSFGLAMTTAPDTPAFGDRKFIVNAQHAVIGGETETTYHEDQTDSSIGVGTHIDGLGHMSIGGRFYNGLDIEALNARDVFGIAQLSASDIPAINTRAVILDIAAYKGVEMMGPSELIYPADLVGAARKQGVCFGEGDVVILHTGWMQKWLKEGDKSFADTEPGIGVHAAQYLADLKVVTVGADTWAVEAYPGETDPGIGVFMVHQILLAKYGIYIIENLNVKPVLDAGHSEMFFSMGVAKLAGSVQTNVNPVGIV